MRIGIYTSVTPGPHTGVGRHLFGTLRGLAELKTDHQYILFSPPDQSLPVDHPSFRRLPIPVRPQSPIYNHLFQAVWLPLMASRWNVDVLHVPNSMLQLYQRRPLVATIYDVTEFALGERVYEGGRHRYRRLAHRTTARRATRILTTSHHSKKDIVHYLKLDPERVDVTYPGVDHNYFRPLAPSQAERERLSLTYGLPPRYLLYVGKIQPRKNLERLLHAFASVRDEYPDVALVLAGTGGWMNASIVELIARLNLKEAVHVPGFIAHDDLPSLFNLAEVFVFPSLYEGFGFPVVEAMACGTPVVTSASSSLGEIAEDAALCIDPHEVSAMAAAIGDCLGDAKLRGELRQKGLARSRRFTWARSAESTLSALERAVITAQT